MLNVISNVEDFPPDSDSTGSWVRIAIDIRMFMNENGRLSGAALTIITTEITGILIVTADFSHTLGFVGLNFSICHSKLQFWLI